MKREESFGVIPLSKKRGHWEVFLIRHARSRYWGFPKGHREAQETPEEAAFRELKEETNLDFVRYLQTEPIAEQYQFLAGKTKVLKRVSYYIAEVAGRVELQKKEIQDGVWLALPQALEKVTYAEGKAILKKVANILTETYPAKDF